MSLATSLHLPPGSSLLSVNESELKIKYTPAVWKQRHDKKKEEEEKNWSCCGWYIWNDKWAKRLFKHAICPQPSVFLRVFKRPGKEKKKTTSRRLCFPDTPVMLLTNYFYLFSLWCLETLTPLAWFSLVTFFLDEIRIFEVSFYHLSCLFIRVIIPFAGK